MYRLLVSGSLMAFLLSVFTFLFLLLVARLSDCEHLADIYIKIRNDGATLGTSESVDFQGKLNYRPGMDLGFLGLLLFPNIILS